MERQKILNPLTGRMVYADGVVAKSIPKMKKSVGVLEGAIKRTLAKKPETKPETKQPEPKKLYGWDDLPDDIKAKISGIVKENVVLQNEKKMRDFLKEVKEYYKREMPDIKPPIPSFFKEQNEEFNKLKLSKMDKYELRDFIYKGEMDRMIKRVVWNRLWLYLEEFSISDYGAIFLRKGTFFMKYPIQTDKEDYIYSLLEYDYRDNYKFFNYVKNHPVNQDINGEKNAFIHIFRGDEMEERSNNPEYEYFTFVEMIYNKVLRDKNGFLIKKYTPSPTIPIKVFYVKISKTSTFYKNYERTKQNKSWISILQDIKPNGFEYSEGELKYTNTDELPSYFTWYIDANNKIRMYIKQKPNFKKP